MKRIYQPVKKKTILIVDDDGVVIEIYREKFQSHGFKVETAGNGQAALQRLKNEPIDLVILDLGLPGTNGVEVLKSIRLEPGMGALPVIALSNPYLTRTIKAAWAAGASDCVTKAESTPGRMLELVRGLLAGAQPNDDRPITKIALSGDSEPVVSLFESEVHEKFVATFLMRGPETLAKMRTSHLAIAMAKPEGSPPAEFSRMHGEVRLLAGSAGLLGFRKIARMSTSLEALCVELQTSPDKITSSVIRTIAQAIDTLAFLFDQAAKPQAEVPDSPRILVVDDEVISRETICSALGKANFAAVSLDDSFAAQCLLEQEHFDLIFLDVEVPGQSGLELCVKIRAMETNRATPVVFVTSHSDFGSRAQSTLSGGNDFIAKPFLQVELVVKTLTWLFKEIPQPVAMAAAKSSIPAEACPDLQLISG